MPTNRSYGDSCAIARALDVVGERWALLIVRELLLGPQRFTDLRQALSKASTNLVADRLRELEGNHVLRRRKLPVPASSLVYELTEWGRELEPIVLALGAWGLRVPLPMEPTRSATSSLLALRTFARPDPNAPVTTCRLELDNREWTIQVAAGELRINLGDSVDTDATLCCSAQTFAGILDDPGTLDDAIAAGSAQVAGDSAALLRILGSVAYPVGHEKAPLIR